MEGALFNTNDILKNSYIQSPRSGENAILSISFGSIGIYVYEFFKSIFENRQFQLSDSIISIIFGNEYLPIFIWVFNER